MKGSLDGPIGKRSHEETVGFNEEENSRVHSRPRAGESEPQSMLSDCNLDFGSFQYSSKFDFHTANSKSTVYFAETFTDTRSKNVRKQEQTLYMENITDLIDILKFCGFNVIGKFDFVEDKYQFIYILQKI